jgi:hypothetical protein
MKRTAVEWLQGEIEKFIDMGYTFTNEFEQAKAMEKEQMIQSFRKGAVVNEPDYYTWVETGFRDEAEKYYNETYGK